MRAVTPESVPAAARAVLGVASRHRRRALLALLSDRVLASGLVRFARLGSVSIALSYGAAMVFLHIHDDSVMASAVAVRALVVLSWIIAGPVALIAARSVIPLQPDGLDALAAQRGVGPGESELLATAAIFVALVRALGLPAAALGIVSLALAPSLAGAAWGLAFLLAVLLYVAGLSAVLAVLARLCVRLAPHRARELLLAVVLGPYAASAAFADLPSLPSACAHALDLVLELGALGR